MERIIITIKGGEVEIKTTGFAGSACQKATDGLSKALGKTTKDTPTSEMYAPIVDHETVVGR